ncbi:MAG: UDP-N-acetylmuramoyl-tripeptide--D-alanyl-D-alanine ligase [Deltaproteobacteria bacterium]|nr:UDP-N-acetylmuramoyl-tripeptide--D-alanyl-D-alanine ligase [Deltaproteobacteria bacterium]
MKVTWNEIIKAINGRLVHGRLEDEFCGVSTDTRTIKAGELFIALKGENFDGHEFVGKAIEKGACGAIVSGQWSVVSGQKYFIVEVEDTLSALGDIAKLWREKHPVPVVAITGSNGKTTTKEMVASILSQKYRVLKTEGNLNNLIGLPQMVLKIDDSHEAAVLELGMNVFGEIKRLSEICKPDIAVITNIGSGHLEGVGSIEGVARAKKEILDGLKADGTFVVNADDPYIREMAKGWSGKMISFGLDNLDADVKTPFVDYNCCYGSGVRLSMIIKGKLLDVTLAGLGLHNVYNATAAAAVALAMGLGAEDIKKGLEEWSPFKGRFELLRLECGVNLIDDSYNANPNSVAMALKTLADVKGVGRGLAVLGDMLELGAHAEDAHYEIGKKAAATGIDYLLLLGPLSSSHTARGAREGGMSDERVMVVSNHGEAVSRINPMLRGGDWVLVKGSRGMAMEKIVEEIKTHCRLKDAG